MTNRRLNPGHSSERGASPISVIILIVILLMALELIAMVGRLAAAHNDVSTAAREAARQASLALTSESADFVALETTVENLQSKGASCRAADASLEGTNFVQGGHVVVNVTCTVDLTDLSMLTLPWPDLDITAEAVEQIETYRAIGTD